MKIRDIIHIIEKHQEFKSKLIEIFESDYDADSKLKLSKDLHEVHQAWMETEI